MASEGKRPSIDVAAILADRAGDAMDLHGRYLNRQMVRVLKTIGFDRNWVAGEGAYLIDIEGRPLPGPALRLRGVRPRAQPSGRAGAARASAGGRDAEPAPARGDAAPGRARRGAARARPAVASAAVLLTNSRRGGGRGRDQDGARRHRAAAHPLLRPRLPRPDDGRPVGERQHRVPGALRPVPAGLRPGAVRRPRRAGAGARGGRRRGLHRRAGPGQGRRDPRPPTICPRRRSCCRRRGTLLLRRRGPDRPRAHRALPRARALGPRAGHDPASRRRCRAATCRSGRSSAPATSSIASSTRWSGRSPTARPSGRTISRRRPPSRRSRRSTTRASWSGRERRASG